MMKLNILTEAEAELISEAVMSLQQHWLVRNEEHNFYTLGVASYLDATDGRLEWYRKEAGEMNAILLAKFGDLYEKIAASLAESSGSRCWYEPSLALPGFHIFRGGAPSPLNPSVHWDLQSRLIDWKDLKDIDDSRQLSFTLALRLPSTGTGLNIWNITPTDHAMTRPKTGSLIAKQNAGVYQPYKRGVMVVHDGKWLHQIAQPKPIPPTESRVTLQGHAIMTKKGYAMYW